MILLFLISFIALCSSLPQTNETDISQVQSNATKTAVEAPLKNSSKSPDVELNESEFDGPIRKCNHHNNSVLNSCLKQIFEDLRPKLSTGIPEINLPPMDPLHIRNISFQHGSGPIKVTAMFTGVEVRGLAGFNKSEFGVDNSLKNLNFDIQIPEMQIVGDYGLSGNVFFFPIGGSGTFWLQLGGVSANGAGKIGVVKNEEGHKMVVVKRTDIDIDITTIKLHLTNLFNGDRLLGSVINNFLNENGKDIFEEVKPQIGAQVGEMVSKLTNKALSALSVDHFDDLEEEN